MRTVRTTRITEIEYLGKMEALAFRLGDGRIFGVPLERLSGPECTPITRVSLLDEGTAVLIEQMSGDRKEVPAHVVLEQAAGGCVCPPR